MAHVTWIGSHDNDYNLDINWSPTGVPSSTDTAVFGGFATRFNITFAGNIDVGGWSFSGTHDFTFTDSNQFFFDGAGISITGGATCTIRIQGGVVSQWFFKNSSTAGGAKIINDHDIFFDQHSSAGSATIITHAGSQTQFRENASAGSAHITNNQTLGFADDTSAGSAIIVNNGSLTFDSSSPGYTHASGGNATITNNSLASFDNGSHGGNAHITNKADENALLIFDGQAKAGNAVIVNHGRGSLSNSGTVDFNGSANADHATITNDGWLGFSDTSTAGSAQITSDSFYFYFGDSSSAGSATIINDKNMHFQATSTAGNADITIAKDGYADFTQSATAGNATIDNSGGLTFYDTSTAANATITTLHGAITYFSENSSGGNAHLIATAGGTVDFSYGTGPAGNGKIAVGSIAGAGTFDLGGNQLTVGGNNSSTEVSGDIDDGGANGGNGASLMKTGTGTLTLSNAHNTYSGGTTLKAGTLMLVAVDAAGTGDITFASGAQTLAIGNAALSNHAFSNHIKSFGSGDAIDLTGLDFHNGATATYNAATHTLTVVSGAITDTLKLFSPQTTHFQVTNDGHGHAEIMLASGHHAHSAPVVADPLDALLLDILHHATPPVASDFWLM